MIRKVQIDADRKSIIGAWEVTCDTCPLTPHLVALSMSPISCVAGISTNMQGAIPTKQCHHYAKDTFEENDDADLVLECTHGETP